MKKPSKKNFVAPVRSPPLLPWLITLWPAIVTVLGMLYLHEAVAESVKTTPHPILLLAILVGTLVSWAAIVLAQWRCTQEVSLAQRWSAGKAATNLALKTQATQSVFAPVYQLLSRQSQPPNPQQALQDEWASGESTLQGLLEFATFMGNALVGMGLVGTFVGLLGSLRDLSSVFNALIEGGGNSVSPAALFTDMITRLQLPMRAMGTAFVASLYGLLGSLVVSLMMVGARKSIARSAHVIHQLVLGHRYETSPHTPPAGTTNPELLATELLATDIATLKHDISVLQQARQQTRDLLQDLHTAFQSLTAVNLQSLQHTEATQPPLLQLGQAVQTLTSQLQTLHHNAQRDAQLHTRQLGESMQALAQQLLTQQAQSQQETAQHSQRYHQALQSLTDLLQAQQLQHREQADQSSQQFSQALHTLTQQLQSQQAQLEQEAQQQAQHYRQHLSQTMAKVGQLLALNNQGQLAAQTELLSSFQRLEELQQEQLADNRLVQHNSQARLNQILLSIAEAKRMAKQKNEGSQAPASSASSASANPPTAD